MEYNWLISDFECTPEKVVTSINWVYVGKNANGTKFEIFGNQVVGEPNLDDFTDFENLTFEQVCGWIENLIDVTAMQINIALQVDLIDNPKVIRLNPPF